MCIHEEDMTSTTRSQEDMKEEAQYCRNLVGIRSIHDVDSEDDADDIQEHNISSMGLTRRDKKNLSRPALSISSVGSIH